MEKESALPGYMSGPYIAPIDTVIVKSMIEERCLRRATCLIRRRKGQKNSMRANDFALNPRCVVILHYPDQCRRVSG